MNQTLKIGITLDGDFIPAWKSRVIQQIATYSDVSFILLGSKSNNRSRSRSGLMKWHMSLDKRHFRPNPDAFEAISLKKVFPAIVTYCLEQIDQELNNTLDLILSLSDFEIPQRLYDCSRSGALFLRHGANGNSNETVLGYDEFFEMTEVFTSALLFKKDKTSSPKIVHRTWSMMPTMSMSRARNEHMWKLSSLILRSVKKIRDFGVDTFLKEIEPNESWSEEPQNRFEKTPSFLKALYNLGRHFFRLGFKFLRKTAYREQWILLLHTKNAPSTTFNEFKQILPPKDRFWADPFLVQKDDRQYLFFEELPFSTDKGHLSVMEVDAQGNTSEAVKILEKPYHLSYPFIFEFEGHYYMIPESYEDQSVQIYECTEFPYQWEFKMNIMTGVYAFDSTLYFYKNKWWLFTVLSEHKGGGHNDELFLFYADTPFTTNWKSHPQNPIVSDVRSARPAGNIYEENGRLIRPSQDCARKYGYGFNLNEIIVLSETEYRERSILHVRPDWNPSLTRTHSFNHGQGMTVIDAVIQRSRFF